MYYCGELFRINFVFTVFICAARAYIQFLKSSKIFHFGGILLNIGFLKIILWRPKNVTKKIISCLGTDWKNKSFCNVSLFANIFRDIPQILLNRRHLKCLKKSAHIFLNMKKFNIMMKRKQLIMIYWQISIEKYVPKHSISLIKIFCNIFSLLND